MGKLDRKTLAIDILYDIVGCFIFSIAIQCFSAPNNIAPGGASGAAILVNHIFQLPISAVSFAINVPLLVMAWCFLGKWFTIKTLKSVVIMTVLLEVCAYLPIYQGNLILAALYGGVLQGLGLAIIFARGSTTGGTDIASRLIQLKYPYISVGKLMTGVDGVVLVAAAIVYGNIENALLGMIVIFTCGRVIDTVLYGLDAGKVMMVISDRYEDIARRIIDELGRGCTVLNGRGSYTDTQRNVLMCAVRKPQYIELKRIVRLVDPDAFLVALEANEIIGEGFKDIDTTNQS